MEYKIDAKNKKLGRLASEVALILQGKKTAKYNPRLPGDDSVVITNLKDIIVTGNKMEDRIYYRHTGYMGHLKSASLQERWTKSPEKVLRSVVEHMLPKNRLLVGRLKRLVVK